MNLLAYVIPAIREIRAPLVGGYLWLFAAWLFAADDVPRASEIGEDSPWAPLHRIADAIGPTGNVIVVSVAALLVGSFVGEVVRWELKKRAHPDRLGDLGEAVPAAKYLVDRALQAYAEAELRLHIALPSVLVTAAFLSHRAWSAAVVSALVVAAMAAHGVMLVRRAQRRAAVAETRAQTRADEMTAGERRREEAHIDVDVVANANRARGEPRFGLRLVNTGTATARGVDVLTSHADGPLLWRGVLPLDLPPGEEVEVPVVAHAAPREGVHVAVRWTDGTGPRSYIKVLTLG